MKEVKVEDWELLMVHVIDELDLTERKTNDVWMT